MLKIQNNNNCYIIRIVIIKMLNYFNNSLIFALFSFIQIFVNILLKHGIFI